MEWPSLDGVHGIHDNSQCAVNTLSQNVNDVLRTKNSEQTSYSHGLNFFGLIYTTRCHAALWIINVLCVYSAWRQAERQFGCFGWPTGEWSSFEVHVSAQGVWCSSDLWWPRCGVKVCREISGGTLSYDILWVHDCLAYQSTKPFSIDVTAEEGVHDECWLLFQVSNLSSFSVGAILSVLKFSTSCIPASTCGRMTHTLHIQRPFLVLSITITTKE